MSREVAPSVLLAFSRFKPPRTYKSQFLPSAAPAGKPKFQVVKEYEEVQRKVVALEREMDGMKRRSAAPAEQAPREAPSQHPPAAGGCGCVVM